MQENQQLSETLNDRVTGNEEQKLDIKPLKTQNTQECEWIQVRLQGKLPERRANHSSWIIEQNDVRYLYIHGGRDLKEGPTNNMYRLDLNGIDRLRQEPNYPLEWEHIPLQGTYPEKISHHTSCVMGDKCIIMGGQQGEKINGEVYCFDQSNCCWSKLKQTGEVPVERDDHKCAKIGENAFIIFGGFVSGSRTNQMYKGEVLGDTINWTELAKEADPKPKVRAAHSIANCKGLVYIFGGQDEDNDKLDDLWLFKLEDETYQQIDCKSQEDYPCTRSGHTMTFHNDKVYIFGGILELTKELNDMIEFDFMAQTFTTHSINDEGGNTKGLEQNFGQSPNIVNEQTGASPNRRGTYGGGSPMKQPTLKATMSTSPKKQQTLQKSTTKKIANTETEMNEQTTDKLSSPVSMDMKNSFIIKNSDVGFDAYYQQMRKRKHRQDHDQSNHQENKFGFIYDVKPQPRDGHTCEIDSHSNMFIFGGDRHYMPFNDLYMLPLRK